MLNEEETTRSIFLQHNIMTGTSTLTVKLLCSYGGTILPSFQDYNKLRYYGGHTRVLSVDRSIPFAKLMLKLEELCRASVSSIRCQLPSEELDALVTITCDADVLNLMEEYDKVAAAAATSCSSPKIRMFLMQLQPRAIKKVRPPHSVSSPSYRRLCYDSSFGTYSSRYNQSGITP